MSYKTILLCLDNLENAERLTKAASIIARKFDAHLIGIHAMRLMDIYPEVAVHLTTAIKANFDNEQATIDKAIEKVFNNVTSKEDFVSEWRNTKAISANIAEKILEHARCSDLVILPQPNLDHNRAEQTSIQREIIEDCGRPVLVIPQNGAFENIGDNMLIGWSPTREATRAAHDAVPFAQKGTTATIFCVDNKDDDNSYFAHTAREMAVCYDRNGIKAQVKSRKKLKLAIGDEILNEAADSGADLIVNGAYGHSKIYDFIVGATTPHLMKHMTVPVLFSC